MFNAPSAATSQVETTFLPVILTLLDGETLRGAIAVRKNGRLGDVLNGSDKYVLFKTNVGEPVWLSHSTIAAVQSNAKPSNRQLDSALKAVDRSNPYKILNVKPGVGREELRERYHEMVRRYHPDQFSNVSLPDEVRDYLDAQVQRANAAHKEILDEMERIEKAKKARAQAARAPRANGIRYFGQ